MTPAPALARALLRALVLAAAVAAALPAAAPADTPERANFDARPEGDTPEAVERAAERLRERLGRFGALSHDDRTGTLRSVGRLDGFLTGPSGRDGADVALGYVRDNATAFGLDGDDVAGLQVVDREFVDGVQHITWEQRYRGVPAVDAALDAAVTGAGRLMTLTGPPAADLAVRSVEPGLGAGAAYAAARASAGATGAAPAIESAAPGAERATRFDDGGRASLALYRGASGYRLAWRVLAPVSSTGVYDVLVDARSGDVVRRANRVNFASPAKVFEYTPAYGPQVDFDFDTDGASDWLTSTTALSGPNAHAFADVHDVVGYDEEANDYNLVPEGGSDVPAGSYENELQTLAHADGDRCIGMPAAPEPPPTFACTWDPDETDPGSPGHWMANREQSVTQLFYFVNRFHDHLENDPDIAFTQENFEVNAGQPLGDPNVDANPAKSDPILAQALDGAAFESGMPDDDHQNNANFLTLPDGLPGLMQMYLWKPPFGGYDGSNDATVVYHEYTHGLSNRLVTDAEGFGALNTAQAGAMGEGWSDFYAMDFLEAQEFEAAGDLVDDPGVVDIFVGDYIDNRTGALFRWQGMDCTPDTVCENPSGPADGNGFTYGDFGSIEDGPDVHSDGEIWGQTLWSVRAALIEKHDRAVGIARTREYVTKGMRLSPPEPSFLDVRNAMLQASSEDDEELWAVFADRGMGYFAGSDGSDDVTPEADDTDPAGLTSFGTLSGRVIDESGVGLGGATVGIAGFDTGLGPDHTDETAGDGSYTIPDIPTVDGKTFPAVRARKDGFTEDSQTNVAVATSGITTLPDFHLIRDFSSAKSSPSSADVVAFTGPNNTSSGCGPGGLIDDDPATVWGSNRDEAGPGADLVGQEIVIELAAPIDVDRVAIDPAAGCGDDASAALGAYEVLGARTPGGPFESLGSGAFDAGDIGTLTDAFSGDSLGIRYLKLHAKSPQGNTGSGAQFLDVAEMHVARVPNSPIGAAADTGAAQDVGVTSATLTGMVIPHGAPAQVVFQYGATPSYGATVAVGPTPAGEAPTEVAAAIGGLQPSTTYHYRVVALRDGREYHGGNGTFTTAAAPQPPPTNPPPTTPPPTNPPANPPAAPRPTLLLDGSLRANRKGFFKVRAFFGDAAPSGDARFTVLNSKLKQFARTTTPVRAGGTVTKTLRLNRRGRRAIKPGRSKRITLELRLPNGQKIKKSLRLARSKR